MPFIIAIVGIIAILGIGGYVLQSSLTEETPSMTTEVTSWPEEQATLETTEIVEIVEANAEPAKMEAARATYTARGEYQTPARIEHIIDVTLTLEGDIVTGADIIYDEGSGFSNSHQERFDSGYRAQVIGKSLDQISLSRVGGASITSRSFNEVVTAIEAQASA
jgi:hypothetical protein